MNNNGSKCSRSMVPYVFNFDFSKGCAQRQRYPVFHSDPSFCQSSARSSQRSSAHSMARSSAHSMARSSAHSMARLSAHSMARSSTHYMPISSAHSMPPPIVTVITEFA